jgi:hypothetical protein
MLPLFVLGIALLIGLYFLSQVFISADPKILARYLRYTAVGVAVVVMVFLAVTGRLGMAMAVGAFLFPLVMRWRAVMNRVKAARGPTVGQQSGIETAWLRMRLDHDTGHMTGEVLNGPFRGRSLDDLSLDELLRLLAECRQADSPSAEVLEAYIDRTHPADWREHAAAGGDSEDSRNRYGENPTRSSDMTRDEAFAILGLEPGADPDAIKQAHHRLMLKMHPDHGGSTYLAARINQAKDLLMRP